MAWKELSITEIIEEKNLNDPEFKEVWDSSRTEYKIIGELISRRKALGLSQAELAQKSGNKQQVISRIENKENSPTLKTLVAIANVMGCDIALIPKA